MKTSVARVKEDLNVRRYPAIGGNIAGTLKTGDTVTVYDDHSEMDDVRTWRYITAGKLHGWVAGEYLSTSTAPAPVPPPVVIPAPVPDPAHPAPTLTVKFGWHVHFNAHREMVLKHARNMIGKIAGFTVVAQPELANMLAEMGYLVMYREFVEPDETYKTDWLHGLNFNDAYKLGREFYFTGKHRSGVLRVKKLPNIYIKIVNEVGYHPMDYAITMGMMDASIEDGRHMGIFPDSVGTPKIEEWPTRIPAMRKAVKDKHVFAPNQYGRLIVVNGQKREADFPVSDDEEYIWHGGRHELIYDAMPDDGARPKIIIGEAGASNSRTTHSWAVVDGIKYSRRLASQRYADKVLFLSLYTLGKWYDCSLDSQIPQAEQLLKAL